MSFHSEREWGEPPEDREWDDPQEDRDWGGPPEGTDWEADFRARCAAEMAALSLAHNESQREDIDSGFEHVEGVATLFGSDNESPHEDDNSESEVMGDTPPPAGFENESQHEDNNAESEDKDDDDWATYDDIHHELLVMCPKGEALIICCPSSWGRDPLFVISKSPKKVTITDRDAAQEYPQANGYGSICDRIHRFTRRRLMPALVTMGTGIWKVEVSFDEDDTLSFAYYTVDPDSLLSAQYS
ncbi:hypothetical protein G7Z17_g1091 [Cylindrodendrum hubeiense]|uniref:Uncharacterized protein n=1 Tax=Cylindrodendrum hubeiense TaxID=595255 RepID=A0A9P5HK76_9HYPO|nr:hypothetical protein G7Z17_g1091 [Cylindrodendrum hubeiense]